MIHSEWYIKNISGKGNIKVIPKSLDNLKIKKSSWSLSYQTKRKLENSVAMLNHLAKPKTIFQTPF